MEGPEPWTITLKESLKEPFLLKTFGKKLKRALRHPSSLKGLNHLQPLVLAWSCKLQLGQGRVPLWIHLNSTGSCAL